MSPLASSIGEAGPVVADLGEHLGAGSRAEPWEAGDDPGVRVLVKRLDGGLLQVASGTRDIYDLMGKDAMVFHHSAHSGNPTDAQYIEHARTWFTSMWDTISYEYLA